MATPTPHPTGDDPADRHSTHPRPRVTVVGIGADGWAGLSEPARTAINTAEVMFGSTRQLALVPGSTTRVAWPTPLLPALPGLLAAHAGRRICALASGDPMHYGLGTTLHRLLGPAHVDVIPHPSAVSLACARLGWPVEEVEVVSVVGRPLAALHAAVQPDRRLLVLSADGRSPAAVARLLTGRGYGASTLAVYEQLGGPAERTVTGSAETWTHGEVDPLNIIAVQCRGADPAPLPTVPGLPDPAYDHDGQLTKREIRAITLARLAPVPGQLLWDVGAGAGSVAIEWLRAHPSCRAVAVERHADRAARIAANAAALGVPALRVIRGSAPAALAGLDPPDAVFVGGGATTEGLLDACWTVLRPGARIVVNAVTVESEQVLADRYARWGGDLTRISIQRAAPVGGLTGWRPMMPVTQWTAHKS